MKTIFNKNIDNRVILKAIFKCNKCGSKVLNKGKYKKYCPKCKQNKNKIMGETYRVEYRRK